MLAPDAPEVKVYPRGTDRVYQAVTAGAGGVHSSVIGELQAFNFSTIYGPGVIGGEDQVEWTVKPWGGFPGGFFRPGDHVVATRGGAVMCEAEFSESVPADDGSWTFKARGYRYNFGDYQAVKHVSIAGQDDLYYPTNDFDAAWAYAHDELMWPVQSYRGITFPVGTYGTGYHGSAMLPAGTFYTMGDLLNNIITTAGNKRAAVWGRVLVVGDDNLSPQWMFDAPASVVGVADTDYFDRVFLLYVPDPAEPGYSGLTVAPDGSMTIEAFDTSTLETFDERNGWADWRTFGTMFAGTAAVQAAAVLEQVKGRVLVNGSFTVSPGAGFKGIGGGVVSDLSAVRAGRAVRLTNLRSSQGNLLPGGEVQMIGQTQFSWTVDATESLTVTLMGAVPRDLASILSTPPPNAVIRPFATETATT